MHDSLLGGAVTPNARLVLHQALDLIIDALLEREPEVPKKKTRLRAPYIPESLPPISPEMKERLETRLEKLGYKRAG